MSVERIYRCNLCGNTPQSSPIHGIWWNSATVAEKRPPGDVEHHLCERCIRDVARIAAELGAKP